MQPVNTGKHVDKFQETHQIDSAFINSEKMPPFEVPDFRVVTGRRGTPLLNSSSVQGRGKLSMAVDDSNTVKRSEVWQWVI